MLYGYDWGIIGAIGINILYFIIIALIFALLSTPGLKDKIAFNRKRKVSILVAARNEQENILDCLVSLAEQNYPNDLYEVWFGDDASQDNTASIIQEFISSKKRTNFHYHFIEHNLPNLKGKQNVLAQLAQCANGEIYLFTDADIVQSPDWIAGLVGAFDNPKVGIVASATVVRARHLFEQIQCLDWLVGIVVVKAFAICRLPTTAMGNNMAIRADVYKSLGGYENIPFSITEDYKLWASTLAQGWQWKWLIDPAVTNYSKPVKTYEDFFMQRKRWFKGGLEGPWYAKLAFFFYILFSYNLFFSIFLLPVFVQPIIILSKYFCDFLFILCILKVLPHKAPGTKRISINQLFAYIFLLNVSNLILSLYFLIPQKIIWKGRAYS